jgi:hypothetical protein
MKRIEVGEFVELPQIRSPKVPMTFQEGGWMQMVGERYLLFEVMALLMTFCFTAPCAG